MLIEHLTDQIDLNSELDTGYYLRDNEFNTISQWFETIQEAKNAFKYDGVLWEL